MVVGVWMRMTYTPPAVWQALQAAVSSAKAVWDLRCVRPPGRLSHASEAAVRVHHELDRYVPVQQRPTVRSSET